MFGRLGHFGSVSQQLTPEGILITEDGNYLATEDGAFYIGLE